MSDTKYDFGRVRNLSPDEKSTVARASRRGRIPAGRFLRGPVSLAWFANAGRLRTRALHVAIALAFRAGIEGTRERLKVPYKLLTEFGLDRHAVYRALNEMAHEGLVVIDARAPGRSPLVTLRMEGPFSPVREGGQSS